MTEGEGYQFEVTRDSKNRLEAYICPGVAASVKLIDTGQGRSRSSGRALAYVILRLETPLGPFLGRDVQIMQNRRTDEFYLRYKQFKTGRKRGAKDEWLDIFGPWDQTTREKVQARIIDLFEELMDREDAGDLPPMIAREKTVSNPTRSTPTTGRGSPAYADEGGSATLDTHPEIAAQLARVKTVAVDNAE